MSVSSVRSVFCECVLCESVLCESDLCECVLCESDLCESVVWGVFSVRVSSVSVLCEECPL